MINQKRFLAVTLTIFIVISSLTITGMAMLFDGLTKLGDLKLTELNDISSIASFDYDSDFTYCSSVSANTPASLSAS